MSRRGIGAEPCGLSLHGEGPAAARLTDRASEVPQSGGALQSDSLGPLLTNQLPDPGDLAKSSRLQPFANQALEAADGPIDDSASLRCLALITMGRRAQ